MANFHQVFGDNRDDYCKHARSYCEYDGDVEVACGLYQHGTLFCHEKCKDYEPMVADRALTGGCKVCGDQIGSENPSDLCHSCQMALDRIKGYTAPIVHGRWEVTVEEATDSMVRTGAPHCNACGQQAHQRTPYCPNCGAKMDDGPNSTPSQQLITHLTSITRCGECKNIDLLTACPLAYIEHKEGVLAARPPDWFCADGAREDGPLNKNLLKRCACAACMKNDDGFCDDPFTSIDEHGRCNLCTEREGTPTADDIRLLRAITVAANSLRYNPDIDPDDAAGYEDMIIRLRDRLGGV